MGLNRKNPKATEGESRQVGIWIRVSTEDQARGDSPEHHEARARQYAEIKDWNVAEVYHLEGVSGKDIINHPEAQRMLKDIKSGHITGLIFSKLARLARNTKQLLDIAEVFEVHGADLVSLHENIDTSTPAGRLFYTMFAAMAQWEREEIADRVAASIPIRAKLGKSLGGPTPYGYMVQDGKLAINPDEAPIRKLMYELFAQHRRKKRVARLLNEMGYRTRRGTKFSDTSVLHMLRDPISKGSRCVNQTTRINGKVVIKDESEWVWQEIEPIVSEELWDTCNAILGESRAKVKPAKSIAYLLAGYVFCQCGEKMYVPSKGVKYTCKKCRNKIPVEDLDAIFYEQLKDFVFSPEDIKTHLLQADETLADLERLIEANKSEQAKLNEQIEELFHLYHEKQLTSEQFGEKNLPLAHRREALKPELARLEGQADYLRVSILSSQQIFNDAQSLASQWSFLDFDERRAIVEQITDSIEIGEGNITVTLLYLHDSPKMMAKRQQNPLQSNRASLPSFAPDYGESVPR